MIYMLGVMVFGFWAGYSILIPWARYAVAAIGSPLLVIAQFFIAHTLLPEGVASGELAGRSVVSAPVIGCICAAIAYGYRKRSSK